MNCWQRMNNIQMHGMPRMNMCLAFVEILACEKQACLNILAFIRPSWRHLSGWKLAYERMSASSQQPCVFSFLATKRCHFEQVPQFPGILNRAWRATGKIGSEHIPGSLDHCRCSKNIPLTHTARMDTPLFLFCWNLICHFWNWKPFYILRSFRLQAMETLTKSVLNNKQYIILLNKYRGISRIILPTQWGQRVASFQFSHSDH